MNDINLMQLLLLFVSAFAVVWNYFIPVRFAKTAWAIVWGVATITNAVILLLEAFGVIA